MEASAPIAHAGHPAEWLPFVAPLILVALAWFAIRVATVVSPGQPEEEEEAEERVESGPEADSGGGQPEPADGRSEPSRERSLRRARP